MDFAYETLIFNLYLQGKVINFIFKKSKYT